MTTTATRASRPRQVNDHDDRDDRNDDYDYDHDCDFDSLGDAGATTTSLPPTQSKASTPGLTPLKHPLLCSGDAVDDVAPGPWSHWESGVFDLAVGLLGCRNILLDVCGMTLIAAEAGRILVG